MTVGRRMLLAFVMTTFFVILLGIETSAIAEEIQPISILKVLEQYSNEYRITTFVNGLSVIQQTSPRQEGIINIMGELILPLGDVSLEIYPGPDGLAAVYKIDESGCPRYALCRSDGFITGFEFEYIEFSNDESMPILAALVGGDYGFVNEYGEWIIMPEYYYAEPFSNGLALIATETQWVYLNTKGLQEIVLDQNEWLSAESFSEGMACVGNAEGKFGYINRLGQLVIRCDYEEAYSFSEGYAVVRTLEGETYINNTGKQLYHQQCAKASAFSNGYAIVMNESGQQGIIDDTGSIVYPLNASHIYELTSKNTAWIDLEGVGLYALFDLKSRRFVTEGVWSPPNDGMGFRNSNGYYIVMHEGKRGLLNEFGLEILRAKHDELYFLSNDLVVTIDQGNRKTFIIK